MAGKIVAGLIRFGAASYDVIQNSDINPYNKTVYITVSGVEMLDEHKYKFYEDTNNTINVLYSNDTYQQRYAEEAPVNRYTLTYNWDTEIPVFDIIDEPLFN